MPKPKENLSDNFKNKVARIENRFIFHARYKLTAREQKVILYLIANVDPSTQERFHEQIIPVKHLEAVLKADGKKWGGLYEEMQTFTDRILEKKIRFPSELKIDGKYFPGKVNWFQSATPIKGKNDEVSLRFLFSEDLKPFLLQLNEYAQINRLEAAPMKSGHAIRMFQIFKAQRDRMRRHEKVSKLSYDLAELKALLGIEDKYPRFNSFRERVLDTIEREINNYTSIHIMNIEYTKEKRSVVGLTFYFTEKVTVGKANPSLPAGVQQNGVPTEEVLKTIFTKSQLRAYRLLVSRKILPEIAYTKIVPTISKSSSEFRGFEDWYVSIAWDVFSQKTTIQKGKTPEEAVQAMAGVFVNWFVKERVFEQGEYFDKIQTILAKQKKETQATDQQHWDERMSARGVVAASFSE